MSRQSNLIVNVEEYTARAAGIKAVCNGLDSIMATLIQQLQSTGVSGIESGETAESFSTFVNEITKMNENLSVIGDAIQQNTADFLAAIEEADGLLFTNQNNKMFTDAEFRACFTVLENTSAPSINYKGVGARFYNLVIRLQMLLRRITDIKDIIDSDSAVLTKNVDDLKDETSKKLIEIQNRVHSADKIYQKKIQAHYELLVTYKKALMQIESILSYSRGVTTGVGLTVLSGYVGALLDPVQKSGYTAGGGGYSVGGGGDGAFGGAGSAVPDDIQMVGKRPKSFNEYLQESLREKLSSASAATEWLVDRYQNLDDRTQEIIKELAEKAFGDDFINVVEIADDICSGEITWDTAKTYLKAIGTESEKINIIITTCETVTSPDGNMKTLMDGYNIYLDSAIDNLAKGNVGQGLADMGMASACGLSSITYGVADVSTELIADGLDGIVDVVTGPLDTIGKVIPGQVGMVIEDISDGIDTIADSVTGFIRKLL